MTSKLGYGSGLWSRSQPVKTQSVQMHSAAAVLVHNVSKKHSQHSFIFIHSFILFIHIHIHSLTHSPIHIHSQSHILTPSHQFAVRTTVCNHVSIPKDATTSKSHDCFCMVHPNRHSIQKTTTLIFIQIYRT